MKPVFHLRPLHYIFRHNWWGLRHGAVWTYKINGKAYLLDLGCVTIGLVSLMREALNEKDSNS